MAEEFSWSILIKVVAQICKMVGFDTITTTPLVVLADILKRFILKLGRTSLQYGVHSGRSIISLTDLSLAFHDCGILPDELTEFLKVVSPLPNSITVPKYPVVKKNPSTPDNSSNINNFMKNENVLPDRGENNSNDSRKTLKMKISLSKIKEAYKVKKSKNKKNKGKRKRKTKKT